MPKEKYGVERVSVVFGLCAKAIRELCKHPRAPWTRTIGGPRQKSKPGAEFEQLIDETDRAKSREARPAIGGPITSQTYEETEIQKAIAWFTSYLVSERESYFTVGQPLHREWRESMDGFFEAALLDQVRVLELADRRVANPWFYPAAREKGVRHLPDIAHKAAVTFLDVVVFNGKITSRDLFHGLVHAAQIKVLGVTEFTELFVRGFLRARSYSLVPLKAHAFAFRCEIRGEPGNTVFSGRRNPCLAAGLPILKPKKELLDKSGNSEDKGVNGSPSQIHPGGNAMQNKKWIILGATVFLAAMFLCIATAAADALSGTWKMNPAKSKYSPGPAPKSLTVVIKSDENEYTVEANGVDAEGKPTHVAYSAKFDGKDYPATGIPNADTVSVKRIDASTVQTTQKKGGQLIMTVTTKVSKDGKTRTSTFVGKDAEGHDVHNVVEFEKQ